MNSGIQRIYRSESTQYTTVPNWVVRDPKYTPNAFRLLAYLLSHQDGYELTYGQIERQTTLGRYAINEAAKFLIAQGWLEWQQDKGTDGRWLAKKWILKDPNANESVAGDSTTESFHYGTTNGHKEEQLLEKPTNKRNTLSEVKQSEFDEFWNEYPKKEGKKPAYKAFASALSRATFEDILAGVIRYKASDKVNRGYIMLASRWLNEDHWTDYYAPAPDSAASERLKERRERELEASRAYLAQLKEQEAQATAPVTCPHGKTLALCLPCSKEINA